MNRQEYQKEYQRNSLNAKEARKRYYQKTKDKWLDYSKEYYSKFSGMLHRARTRAHKKNLEFSLELKDVLDLPMICPVFNIPMKFSIKTKSFDSPSLDRIDNTKGYSKENTRMISNRANSLKSNGTLEEFKQIVEYMTNYT